MPRWWPRVGITTEGEPLITRLFAPTAKERDQAETQRLYDIAQQKFKKSVFADSLTVSLFIGDAANTAFHDSDKNLPTVLHDALYEMVKRLAGTCPELFEEPVAPGNPEVVTIKDAIEHRESLRLQIKYLDDLAAVTDEWDFAVLNLCRDIIDQMPELHEAAGTLQLSAPLVALARSPHELVDRLLGLLNHERFDKADFFRPVVDRILRNMLAVNRRSVEDWIADPKPLRIQPTDLFKDHAPEEVVRLTFRGTPFEDLLLTDLPLTIPEEVRFEHMHVLAGTGHGKTQLLQHLIAADLQRPADEIPSMVILDSQGDMINVLKRLALFDPDRSGSLASRLLIVDPSDVAFPPSLNLFDVHSDRLEHYTQRDREQVLAGIIEIYDYIFGGLLGAELTQKQSMVFRFLAQLMLSIPGATIHTLRELLEDATPYMPAVQALPPTARGFFENHFFGQPYKATRDQILRRLYGVLQNPSFERMFAQPENRLDLFDTLNNGGIVLVNTAKDFLKSEASSIFGRYIIALTLKAAFERATLPRSSRRPTFLWIDEASEYFDDNIDNLLIQARKFNLGIVMAHQYLGQLSRNLPASLMTNTSVKLVGGVSDRDARAIASELRTTPDFLNSMTKGSKSTNFAAFARNHTPHALRLTVPFGTAESLDQMPEESIEALLAMSRQRLASKPVCQSVDGPGGELQASDQTENPPSPTSSDDAIFDDPYD